MPDYIDLKDIPGAGERKRKYPWGEWAAIPEGKALEVTEFLDGQSTNSFCASNRLMAHQRSLRLTTRNGRVFIIKEKQP